MLKFYAMKVEEGMLESIRDVIIRANEAYPETDRHVWVTEWPGQVLHCFCASVFSPKRPLVKQVKNYK